jgi:hypothetical protein
VTLAQLIEAGVIEPGEQVLTVTVGGPGGTNTFIAGGHCESAGRCISRNIGTELLAFDASLTSGCGPCMSTGMQGRLGQISNPFHFGSGYNQLRMSERSTENVNVVANVQICWKTVTSSTMASCSRARHRGPYMSSGWSTRPAWCVPSDPVGRHDATSRSRPLLACRAAAASAPIA